ncbi:hypothetical protein [Rhizobium leguminosarum]|uniref:hypothetical protein n=1 Tax=Rhizobium leguminosarum TaxID=384 RepID=UPI003F9995FC
MLVLAKNCGIDIAPERFASFIEMVALGSASGYRRPSPFRSPSFLVSLTPGKATRAAKAGLWAGSDHFHCTDTRRIAIRGKTTLNGLRRQASRKPPCECEIVIAAIVGRKSRWPPIDSCGATIFDDRYWTLGRRLSTIPTATTQKKRDEPWEQSKAGFCSRRL